MTLTALKRAAILPEARTAPLVRGNLWYDTKGLADPAALDGVVIRALQGYYSGLVAYPENLAAFLPVLSERSTLVVSVTKVDELSQLDATLSERREQVIVAAADPKLLNQAKQGGHKTCLRQFVVDRQSLHDAIELGGQHDYVIIRFKDPTNIPLELVIASLQKTSTVLIKEINSGDDLDDAIVSLGVMEVGADGVLFSPSQLEILQAFGQRVAASQRTSLALETATITQSRPVGMGARSCIDVATLFSENEGILVGSTSQGGFLCCPEIFHLPYMELRPFRVNAGAVHSYVYNLDGKTSYMTELRAGSEMMAVDHAGNVRGCVVGRMKTEVRPLRLLEAQFDDGCLVNVLLQDDWHVRVYSADGKPLNITEIKPGDKVLAHKASPGRHVGIKIDENIVEE